MYGGHRIAADKQHEAEYRLVMARADRARAEYERREEAKMTLKEYEDQLFHCLGKDDFNVPRAVKDKLVAIGAAMREHGGGSCGLALQKLLLTRQAYAAAPSNSAQAIGYPPNIKATSDYVERVQHVLSQDIDGVAPQVKDACKAAAVAMQELAGDACGPALAKLQFARQAYASGVAAGVRELEQTSDGSAT